MSPCTFKGVIKLPPSSDKVRTHKQLYYALNKDEINEKQKLYRMTHKEQKAVSRRAYSTKHRVRLSANQKATNCETRANLVLAHGGRCVICGYDNCLAALDFHHVIPDEKDCKVMTVKESEKSVLLCSNCHREHHHGGIEY